MLAEVFRFELRYQLTRKVTWFFFLVINLLLPWMSAGAFFNGARLGGYPYNAPFTIALAAVMGGLFGMVMGASLAGDAAARDVRLRMSPLVYSTPIGKAAYLGGRYLAVFVVAALLMAAVPVGQYLLLYLPGLDADLIAPFRVAPYLLAYVSLILPTVFATSALMFAAALLGRRPMVAFATAAGLFVSAVFTNGLLAQVKGLWTLARLLDPFALTWMVEATKQRTALQKGQLLIGFEPTLLANRALWIGIGGLALAWAYARFSFVDNAAPARRRGWFARRNQKAADPMDALPMDLARAAPPPLPAARQRFDGLARWRQVLAIAAASFSSIVMARGFLVVLAVAGLVALTGSDLMEHVGVPMVPVTGMLAQALGSSTDFFGFVAPLMCVYYAGELVWREREAGMGPIVDATPLHDWVPLLGKGLGLALALAVWQALLVGAGLLTQLRMGYTDLQPLLWLQTMLGLGLSSHLLFAVAAIAIHVLLNQKFAGYLAGLVACVLMLFPEEFGIGHRLLVYASDPGWTYSDMRGFGGTLGPVLWFKLYWVGWALLLAVGARLLWVRGPEQGLRERWALARARFSTPVGITAGLAALVIAGAGGYIFYNTNVLNEYTTASQRVDRRVEYERRYAATAADPQPLLVARRLRVELHPERGTATVQGRDTFVNRTDGPIRTLHVETPAGVDARSLAIDRPTAGVIEDSELRHRTIKLQSPLKPGESVALDYTLGIGGQGFSLAGRDTSVTADATYFDQGLLPELGYQRGRELADESLRRQFGLPARPAITPVTDARAPMDLRGAERITVDTVIGTAADQTAVAPGQLERSWTQGGRRYFHYLTRTPIRNAFGLYSARYAVHESRWNDVAIRIYHHPAHAANVPRMAQAAKASLERYSRVFGPYPASQLTLVEAPGYYIGAHSYPTNVRYFEGYALMDPASDWRRIDFSFAVMAHELAHQWWGGQVTPAQVAGAPFVSESLAWYSALGVVGEAKGQAHLDRLLDVLREDYLDPRARDGVPLLEAADWFAAYRVGPFSMVALREAIGGDRVDLALRRFLQKHGAGTAPLPTSLDLYAELKAVTPPAQQELLDDLLARNTFWNLRARSAVATPVGEAWQVTLQVGAQKVAVDKRGRESPRPLHEPIEIGLYGPATETGPGKLLYLAAHRLQEGEQRITVTVPERPATAGIDPRNVLIDTRRSDNLVKVSLP